MPIITDVTNMLIDIETLKKLKERSKINSWEELKKRLEKIVNSNKESFSTAMGLSNEDLQYIGIDNEELYEDKQIWIDSINSATAQTNKQDPAAVIVAQGNTKNIYGPVMEICGEDKQKTIHSINDSLQRSYWKNSQHQKL